MPDASAYSSTFAIGACLCLLAAVVAWVLPGHTLSAPRPDPRFDEREIEEGELAAAGLQRLEDD